ncbi:MAG: virulence protein RhuM/Fic/DOC family protein [Bacteroidota bacterium]
MDTENQVVRYISNDGKSDIVVNLANETVWLSLNDLVTLFDRDKSVISRHIGNVFKEGELDRDSTVAKFATVQQEGDREIKRDIERFNLDVIISVGYRVKSKNGTNFRIWATNILKKYLIENTRKTSDSAHIADKYRQLFNTIQIAAHTAELDEISATEAQGILKILQQYAYALEILDRYDHNQLPDSETISKEVKELTHIEAKKLITEWQAIENTTTLFGREKDDSFRSSLYSIYQTVNGNDVYPGIEEKAANLLYFIVKNHSFTDGNKRIAAGLFAYFLDMNDALYKRDGSKIIGDNALVAITIMIAESKAEEKDTMVKLVVSLINSNN